MALIIPPGFAQVLIPLKHPSVNRSAAITYGVDIRAFSLSFVELANKQANLFAERFGPGMTDGLVIGPARVTIGQDGTENLTVVGTFAGAGASETDLTTPQVAVLLQKVTNRGGRRGRGRTFIPWWLPDTAVDEAGIITPAAVTSRQTTADGWLDDLAETTNPTPMVILHNAGGVTLPGSPSDVTGLVVSNLVATQRRRVRS